MSSKRRRRRHACEGKVKHKTREQATMALVHMLKHPPKSGKPSVYHCPHCGHYHWGHC